MSSIQEPIIKSIKQILILPGVGTRAAEFLRIRRYRRLTEM
jgi:hypothetical protein